MMGEYRVMGVYPRGHVMQFVRPTLDPDVLPTAAVEALPDGQAVRVAGWPVARQHPRGRHGTVFVTIEDEEGDTQIILWGQVFARYRRVLGSRVLLVSGTVSRYDGTANVIASHVQARPHPRPHALRPRLAVRAASTSGDWRRETATPSARPWELWRRASSV